MLPAKPQAAFRKAACGLFISEVFRNESQRIVRKNDQLVTTLRSEITPMQIEPTKTVRELASEIPGATRLFEKLNIDYCCRGDQLLGEACTRAGLSVHAVCRWLTALPPRDVPESFQALALVELTEYIVNKHHAFTRNELERLTALLAKVCPVHGGNHPELLQIQSEFQMLGAELKPHMMKEERILFPHIAQLETAAVQNGPAPLAPFGTVRNPIAVMMREHDAAGDILKSIRRLSRDFAIPEDACLSYRALYGALKELEADLHQHIHLENNILFPRALELEDTFRAGNSVVTESERREAFAEAFKQNNPSRQT
jgi:regulator of cell morphogenesis and NO signaling